MWRSTLTTAIVRYAYLLAMYSGTRAARRVRGIGRVYAVTKAPETIASAQGTD